MRRSRPLTAKAAKAATHSGKTPHTEWLADGLGHGLMLAMKPSGAKSWVQRIVVQGRRRAMGLGSFELVTLAEARDAAFANRRIARRGGDPFENRRRPSAPTFAEAAAQVVDARAATWKNTGKSKEQWESSLATYAFPALGDMSVADIAGADVMKVLTPIWSAKRETASRVRQRISAVMQWAVAHGYRADDPAGPAVLQALPKGEAKAKRHHRALPHAEVAGAIATVAASDAWIGTKLAFEFIVLTACRSGEARGATWGEIDVGAKGVDDPRRADEGEDRAPGAAVAALPGGPRRSAEPSPNGRGGRSRLPKRPRPPARLQRLEQAPARLRRRSRAARLPQQLPGLGVGMHGRAARRDGGGARAHGPEPDRGRLREERPVRTAARADGRMGGVCVVHRRTINPIVAR